MCTVAFFFLLSTLICFLPSLAPVEYNFSHLVFCLLSLLIRKGREKPKSQKVECLGKNTVAEDNVLGRTKVITDRVLGRNKVTEDTRVVCIWQTKCKRWSAGENKSQKIECMGETVTKDGVLVRDSGTEARVLGRNKAQEIECLGEPVTDAGVLGRTSHRCRSAWENQRHTR